MSKVFFDFDKFSVSHSTTKRTGYGFDENETKRTKAIELMTHSNANATNSTSGSQSNDSKL